METHSSTRRTFDTPADERTYLEQVKAELDGAHSKAEAVEVWKRHYLTIGHRKLGRLLLGRPIEEIVKDRS